MYLIKHTHKNTDVHTPFCTANPFKTQHKQQEDLIEWRNCWWENQNQPFAVFLHMLCSIQRFRHTLLKLFRLVNLNSTWGCTAFKQFLKEKNSHLHASSIARQADNNVKVFPQCRDLLCKQPGWLSSPKQTAINSSYMVLKTVFVPLHQKVHISSLVCGSLR